MDSGGVYRGVKFFTGNFNKLRRAKKKVPTKKTQPFFGTEKGEFGMQFPSFIFKYTLDFCQKKKQECSFVCCVKVIFV